MIMHVLAQTIKDCALAAKGKFEIGTKEEWTDKEVEKRVRLQAWKHNSYIAYINGMRVLKYV